MRKSVSVPHSVSLTMGTSTIFMLTCLLFRPTRGAISSATALQAFVTFEKVALSPIWLIAFLKSLPSVCTFAKWRQRRYAVSLWKGVLILPHRWPGVASQAEKLVLAAIQSLDGRYFSITFTAALAGPKFSIWTPSPFDEEAK